MRVRVLGRATSVAIWKGPGRRNDQRPSLDVHHWRGNGRHLGCLWVLIWCDEEKGGASGADGRLQVAFRGGVVSIYGGNPEAPKRRQVSIAFFSLSSWLPPPNGTQGTAVREPSARLRFPSSYKSVLLLCTVGFDIQWMGFDSTRPNATPRTPLSAPSNQLHMHDVLPRIRQNPVNSRSRIRWSRLTRLEIYSHPSSRCL